MVAKSSARETQFHNVIDTYQYPAFKQYFVKMSEICEVLRVHRSTVDRWIAAGEFPRPIKKTKGAKALWPTTVIRQWLAEQCQDA